MANANELEPRVEAVLCARCGVFIATVAELTYTDGGDPMCVACRDRQDLEQRERRIARQVRNLAYSSAVAGLVAIPFALFFVLGGLPSVAAFASALRSMRLLRAATPHLRAILGSHHRLAMAAAAIGLVTGALGSLVLVLSVGEVLLRLALQRH